MDKKNDMKKTVGIGVYEKDPSIVSRNIDDETILVPIKRNVGDLESIYTLNEVGARIWNLLDGQKNLQEIKETIALEYEVSAEEAEDDVVEFFKQLEEVGAIVPKS